jgi:hypothetical protein
MFSYVDVAGGESCLMQDPPDAFIIAMSMFTETRDSWKTTVRKLQPRRSLYDLYLGSDVQDLEQYHCQNLE